MKEAVFIYETAQVGALEQFLTLHPKVKVIACGADTEYILDSKGIGYTSARELRTTSTPERLTAAKGLGYLLVEDSPMSFFSYRGVHVGQLYRPAIQYFVGNFLYAIDIVAAALEESYEQVYVFGTTVSIAPAGAILGKFNADIFSDAVLLVCKQRGISHEVLTSTASVVTLRTRLNLLQFSLKRAVFGFGIQLVNWYVRLFVSRKKIRILASEMWKNIEPLMHELRESELVLLDRTESLKIGWKGIVQNRMQFVHGEEFVTGAVKHNAKKVVAGFTKEWQTVQDIHPALGKAAFKDYSLTPQLTAVMEHLIRYSEKVVRDIDGGYSMLESLQPDLVMVRAGLSGQTHFAMLCEIARILSIPSLEVQHGILSVFSGDFTSGPSSEYIAEYGPIVREELSAHNFAPRSTFVDIGSPRFDVYLQKHVEREPMADGTFNMLHIGPPFLAGDWNDSYDVYDFFDSVASAARHIPNVQVTVKLRSGGGTEPFYREVMQRTFKDVPYVVETTKPLWELLQKTDVVVSGHSTAFVEALLVGKPVILDASLPIYAALAAADLDRFQAEGALVVAKNQNELAGTLEHLSNNPEECKAYAQRAQAFMQKHYLLSDGRSSERLADFIRTLTKKG